MTKPTDTEIADLAREVGRLEAEYDRLGEDRDRVWGALGFAQAKLRDAVEAGR